MATRNSYEYTVYFEPLEEGGYNIHVPALPEICSWGKTLEEARQLAREAIELVLEDMLADGEVPPCDEAPTSERIAVSV